MKKEERSFNEEYSDIISEIGRIVSKEEELRDSVNAIVEEIEGTEDDMREYGRNTKEGKPCCKKQRLYNAIDALNQSIEKGNASIFNKIYNMDASRVVFCKEDKKLSHTAGGEEFARHLGVSFPDKSWFGIYIRKPRLEDFVTMRITVHGSSLERMGALGAFVIKFMSNAFDEIKDDVGDKSWEYLPGTNMMSFKSLIEKNRYWVKAIAFKDFIPEFSIDSYCTEDY